MPGPIFVGRRWAMGRDAVGALLLGALVGMMLGVWLWSWV